MARNNEPAFRRKTPLLICSIRTEIPYPCIGSSANVFRMSISSVPWTRSLGLSGIKPYSPWLPRGTYASSTGCQEEKTPKFMRKRPEDSWRQANSQGIWRKFGAKTESNMVQKTAERPGWERGLSGLGYCYYRFATPACDLTISMLCASGPGSAIAVHFGLRQLRRDACGDLCGIDLVPGCRACEVRVFVLKGLDISLLIPSSGFVRRCFDS